MNRKNKCFVNLSKFSKVKTKVSIKLEKSNAVLFVIIIYSTELVSLGSFVNKYLNLYFEQLKFKNIEFLIKYITYIQLK